MYVLNFLVLQYSRVALAFLLRAYLEVKLVQILHIKKCGRYYLILLQKGFTIFRVYQGYMIILVSVFSCHQWIVYALTLVSTANCNLGVFSCVGGDQQQESAREDARVLGLPWLLPVESARDIKE